MECVVSMRPRRSAEVPELTVRMARAAFPKGALAIRIRDELGELFDDEWFAMAFGARGKPGISPGQLGMVTVLQFVENLTDRQAADAVRGGSTGSTAWGWSWRIRALISRCSREYRTRLLTHGLDELAL